MYLKIKGLVLRVSIYNDADALLTVLSQTNGKVTLKARGLRRKNSPLAAACQLLALSEFTVFCRKDTYTIHEATPLELFLPLRNDIRKLSLASYFAQVTETVYQEDAHTPEIMSLLLNSIHVLTEKTQNLELVKAVFEIRIACLSGYTPDLNCCHLCGDPNPQFLNLSEGCMECSKCRGNDWITIRMPLNTGALEAMRYICKCDAKKLFSFEIGEMSLLLLGDAAQSYLLTQLECDFTALDVYKTLCM